MGERIARRVSVHGRVQGVFFRDTMLREAERRGVTGWVRNADDGTVEAHLEGPTDAVQALVDFCREGPQGASVQRVEVHDAAPEGHAGFTVD